MRGPAELRTPAQGAWAADPITGQKVRSGAVKRPCRPLRPRRGCAERSYGRLASDLRSRRVRLPMHPLSGADDAQRRPLARAGCYPHRSWCDLCIAGTITQDLADHVPIAWGWGEDVQTRGSGERCVWAAASVCGTQAQGCGADRPGLPDHCHPGGRPGWLLDPPGAAIRRDREPCGRPRVDPDLAPRSAGEDRPDRWRETLVRP